MNSADLKLEIFRLVDSQQENDLQEIYSFLKSKFSPSIAISNLEKEYMAMAMDEEREAEAIQWIEGSNNYEEL